MAVQITSLKVTLKASSFFRGYTEVKEKIKSNINVGLKSERIKDNLKEFSGSSKMEILIRDNNKTVEYKGEYIIEFSVKTDNNEFLKQQEVDEAVVGSSVDKIFGEIENVFKSAGFNDFKLPRILERKEDKNN